MARGRKGKYETHVKPYLKKIEKWCNTMTEKQIAKRLGIANSTFNEYKKQFPELTEAIKKGRYDLIDELHSALIKKAKGYRYTETKEVTEEVKFPKEIYQMLLDAGLTPAQIGEARVVKTEICHKEQTPDTAAINLALKNYDKDNWANDPQMLDIRKKELKLKEKQIENNGW